MIVREWRDRFRGNGLDVAYIEGADEGHGFRHPWNLFYAGLAQQEMTRECLLEVFPSPCSASVEGFSIFANTEAGVVGCA